jgi:uncharacterized membrane protein
MRSGFVVSFALLAACGDKPAQDQPETVNLPGSLNEVPPMPPVPPGSPEPSPAATRFKALGTEPFWSIEVGSGLLRYSSPENLKGTGFAAIEAPLGKGWRFAGTLESKPVVLVIEPGECSDGMSDTVYAYTARFSWGTQTERGCAKKL